MKSKIVHYKGKLKKSGTSVAVKTIRPEIHTISSETQTSNDNLELKIHELDKENKDIKSHCKALEEKQNENLTKIRLLTECVDHAEAVIGFKQAEIVTTQQQVVDLEKELSEEIHWRQKFSNSSKIQDDIISDLSSKLRTHIQTIQHLEHKVAPQVNNMYVRGGRGRGHNNRHRQASNKPKRCNVPNCDNLVLRCEKCGQSIEKSFCNSCKFKSEECTDCMYAEPLECNSD